MGDLSGASRDRTWSSDAVQAGAAVSTWTQLVSEEIAEMAVQTDREREFGAAWTRYGLGPLDLNFLTCTPQRVLRSAEMIVRGRAPSYELLFVRRGRVCVQHGQETCEVPIGGFLLLDDQQPYSLDFPDGGECLTAHLPETWLRPWIASPRTLAGQRLGVDAGWSRPLAGLLTAIADVGLSGAALPRSVIADQMGAMCALLAGPTDPDCDRRSGLHERIVSSIAERHGDPDLEPDAIARDLGISRRHLHRVLSRYGQSYGQVLNETRLKRAAALLLNYGHQHVPIGEIAWLVGYADQSHFARLFKVREGLSPSAFRARGRGLVTSIG